MGTPVDTPPASVVTAAVPREVLLATRLAGPLIAGGRAFPRLESSVNVVKV
jgi:hypothetical protein